MGSTDFYSDQQCSKSDTAAKYNSENLPKEAEHDGECSAMLNDKANPGYLIFPPFSQEFYCKCIMGTVHCCIKITTKLKTMWKIRLKLQSFTQLPWDQAPLNSVGLSLEQTGIEIHYIVSILYTLIWELALQKTQELLSE